MQKIITACLLLIILSFMQTEVFAATLNCSFKDTKVSGVKSIKITQGSLIINKALEIPLERSRVNCGHFANQTRFDGASERYQIVLRTCTSEADLEGYLIDSVNEVSADVICNEY